MGGTPLTPVPARGGESPRRRVAFRTQAGGRETARDRPVGHAEIPPGPRAPMSRTRNRARTAPPARPPRTPALRIDAGPLNPASTARLERFTWIVLGLVFAALLVFALGPHRIGDYFTETDFYGAYADGARMIQKGRLDPARYAVVGPVYEIALALVGFVIRDLLTAAPACSDGAATRASPWSGRCCWRSTERSSATGSRPPPTRSRSRSSRSRCWRSSPPADSAERCWPARWPGWRS